MSAQHPTSCICVRCMTVANAMAWANAKERKPAGAEVIAGLLLREMSDTAALRELLRAVRYVKLAQEGVEPAAPPSHLRLIHGGKSEEQLVKDWEETLP